MKIAIVGFDTEGSSTYEYLRSQGHSITICDQNTEAAVPEGVATKLGTNYLEGLDQFDLIVRTPGLHPAKILAQNPSVQAKITSHLNLFMESVPTKNIIGVTGTKGKGTTSSLITEMLRADGKDVFLGGNIGIPPLGFIEKLTQDSWVVLELSSFQLIDLKYSPHIGVCLMVVPEHLNWHEDYEEYVAAKQQLFIHQQEKDIAIYYAPNETSESIAAASEGQLLPYMQQPGARVQDGVISIDGQEICKTHELRLLGGHNVQNACAAVTAVWQATHNIPAIRKALTSFSGLEHRLEFVRQFDGVKYYDDSFGTTPETAIVAMEAFAEPKVVILGGSDKGASFEELAQSVVKNNVRTVIAIGQMGPVIAHELSKLGYEHIVEGARNMAEIISQARISAQDGDVVLLSTGCASFGMFENYKDRGNQFKEAVLALE